MNGLKALLSLQIDEIALNSVTENSIVACDPLLFTGGIGVNVAAF